MEYDPSDPGRARIAGTFLSLFPAWLFLLPAAFLVVSLALGTWWITASLKLHSLAVYGTACLARLEEIRPVAGVNPPPWRITWTLESPPGGIPPQGSAMIPRSHPFAKKYRKGDSFWIVADEFSGRAYPWIFQERSTMGPATAGGDL